jgi:signal transduction histidine kinase
VAIGAAVAASLSALLSAAATIVFAALFLQRAEDRRIEDATVTFAAELGRDGSNLAAIRQVHREESAEMSHTGMAFAVFDGAATHLAGDTRLALPPSAGCSTMRGGALRVCRAQTPNGLVAVVGAPHVPPLPWLGGGALSAAVLAAALALGASWPIARRLVGPLTRLRQRISEIDVEALSRADLGADEHVAEVDALRRTIAQLIERVDGAIAQAHRFAANAAHELRTPLATVRGELELLAEKPERDGAARAQHKLSELSVLVERLLILSVPARTPSDHHELISLRDLLEDAVHALPAPDRARVTLTESDAHVRGDGALLAMMMTNALSNALKFAVNARVEIALENGVAVLHVDDDGPGVDAADRERVFEPFVRTNEAVRRRVSGHGLGLALIRHVAVMHGGSAALVDKPTPGARLELRLPAA